MSLSLVISATVMLLIASANLLLAVRAVGHADRDVRRRLGWGPLGVALIALGGATSIVGLLPSFVVRNATGIGALMSVAGLLRDSALSFRGSRWSVAALGVLGLFSYPVALALQMAPYWLGLGDPLSFIPAWTRGAAGGAVLYVFVAQVLLMLRARGEERHKPAKLALAVGLGEAAASVAAVIGGWRTAAHLPDPVLGIALVVELATFVHLSYERPLPRIRFSRALTYVVLGLGVALGGAYELREAHVARPLTELALSVVLALLASALLLVFTEVVTNGVERALFPRQAQLTAQLAGARGEVAALRSRLERTERLARAGELAMAVAHEVKNPLAAVRGYAQLLGDAPEKLDPATLGKAVRIIRDESDRIDARIASLLHLGRAPVPSAPQPLVALDPLVADSVAVVGTEPGAEGIRLELKLDGAKIRGEPDALRGALVNLLRNALEASAARAEITVRTHRHEQRARIEIADRGSGLKAEVAAHLFEPFRTTKAQGTGLGLVIARSAVEAAGGTLVLAAREDGPGARAIIDLGLSEEA